MPTQAGEDAEANRSQALSSSPLSCAATPVKNSADTAPMTACPAWGTAHLARGLGQVPVLGAAHREYGFVDVDAAPGGARTSPLERAEPLSGVHEGVRQQTLPRHFFVLFSVEVSAARAERGRQRRARPGWLPLV